MKKITYKFGLPNSKMYPGSILISDSETLSENFESIVRNHVNKIYDISEVKLIDCEQ